MGTTLNSLDAMIVSARVKGMFKRAISDKVAATSAALTTCGFVSAQRFPNPLTMPSAFGSGITGALFTLVDIFGTSGSGAYSSYLAAIETTLGTLTISGNSFAANSTMPSKAVMGSSVTTASLFPLLWVSASLTATTPVITITYTDQDGNTGNTATLTLPTNALVDTCFLIAPHLASGDTGIRAVTNMSTSAGSAGTLKVLGLLPIGLAVNSAPGGTTNTTTMFDPLTMPWPIIPADASDKIGLYCIGSNNANDVHAFLAAIADY